MTRMCSSSVSVTHRWEETRERTGTDVTGTFEEGTRSAREISRALASLSGLGKEAQGGQVMIGDQLCLADGGNSGGGENAARRGLLGAWQESLRKDPRAAARTTRYAGDRGDGRQAGCHGKVGECVRGEDGSGGG
ncbi:hypothetical protein B0O80DRAFT_432107 [Mortierella sp. GBAus27b]|nr:hypothetical protein B0O80DRAFT_432107 [Mortierella sp. GBAus27b]